MGAAGEEVSGEESGANAGRPLEPGGAAEAQRAEQAGDLGDGLVARIEPAPDKGGGQRPGEKRGAERNGPQNTRGVGAPQPDPGRARCVGGGPRGAQEGPKGGNVT